MKVNSHLYGIYLQWFLTFILTSGTFLVSFGQTKNISNLKLVELCQNFIKTNLDSAEIILDKIRGRADNGDHDLIFDYHLLAAKILRTQSEHPKSRRHLYKAIDIVIDSNPKKYAQVLNTLGRSYVSEYRLIRDIDSTEAYRLLFKSLQHYEESLRLFTKVKDSLRIARCYNNLGSVHNYLDHGDISSKNYNHAIDIYSELELEKDLIEVKLNMANRLDPQKNKQEKINIYKYCLKYFIKNNLSRNIITTQHNLSFVYRKNKEYDKSIQILNKALNIADTSHHNDLHNFLLKKIAHTYELKSDFKNSLKYYHKYWDSYKNEFNIETKSKLDELGTKYNNEKLSKEKFIAESKQKQNGQIAAGLGLLLLLGGLYYGVLLRNNRLKRQVLESELKDQQQQAQLRAVNARLDGEENERKRVASVLHDSIASRLAATAMHIKSEQLKGNESLGLAKASDILKTTGERVRNLSHDLVSPILIKLGLYAAVEDLTEKYSSTNLKISIKIEDVLPKLPVKQNTKLYYIIQELLNNIIRHSEASEAGIHIDQIEDHLTFDIWDNGITMSAPDQQQANGLGLNLILSRVKGMGGSVQWPTNDENPKHIIIKIPLKSEL